MARKQSSQQRKVDQPQGGDEKRHKQHTCSGWCPVLCDALTPDIEAPWPKTPNEGHNIHRPQTRSKSKKDLDTCAVTLAEMSTEPLLGDENYNPKNDTPELWVPGKIFAPFPRDVRFVNEFWILAKFISHLIRNTETDVPEWVEKNLQFISRHESSEYHMEKHHVYEARESTYKWYSNWYGMFIGDACDPFTDEVIRETADSSETASTHESSEESRV